MAKTLTKADPAEYESPLEFVGQPLPRPDARAKVTGHALYLEDLAFKGMLYGKVVRSTRAHAKLLKVDVSEASQLPGVVGIVTGEELDSRHGESLVDQHFLARDRVRYVGEAVAVVAATTEQTAAAAAELVQIHYEDLPAVFDVMAAVRPDAPLLHPELESYSHAPGITTKANTNICNHFVLSKGDVDKGFEESEHIFENTYSTPMQQHCSLEPHGAVCVVTDEDEVTLWTNNDSPYRCRKELASALDLPLGKVTVITVPNIGGNFGGKGGLKAEADALAIAWKIRNRPIRVLYSRQEEFVSLVRHPSVTRMKTGTKADGSLVACQVEMFLDTGAYAEKGPTVARFAGVSASGPYRIPNVQIDVYCVYTNNPVAGAMRGYGGPQGAWAYESQMDLIARQLQLDPLELRLRHVYREGDEHANGQELCSMGLEECLRKVASAMEWDKPLGKNQGRGIACMERAIKTPFGSAAFLKVNEDGTADLLSSTTEVGQGSDGILRQIAAEELGIPVEHVRKATPNTALTPFDSSTTSSRSTFHMGNAVQIAARDAKDQLLTLAASQLGAEPHQLDLRQGRIFSPTEADGIPISKVMAGKYGPCGTVLGRGYYIPEMPEGPAEYYTRGMIFWLQGACGVKVEVDETTGQVEVLKLWGAYDAGKAINPLNCEGQIEGGLAMGLGLALSEEVNLRDGQVLNPSFLSYRLPSSLEVPEIVSLIVEEPHPEGPFGAKGMGETTNVPVPPAIANAIDDAVGARVRTLPITPERVLEALRTSQRSAVGNQSAAADPAEG